MKTYSITITEQICVNYTVNAKSKEEAEEKFDHWVSNNTEQIGYDLLQANTEWEFSEPIEEDELSNEPDIE